MLHKQHFTTHHTWLGFDLNFVCFLCQRGPRRAIAYTETEKETQDSCRTRPVASTARVSGNSALSSVAASSHSSTVLWIATGVSRRGCEQESSACRRAWQSPSCLGKTTAAGPSEETLIRMVQFRNSNEMERNLPVTPSRAAETPMMKCSEREIS